MDLSAVFRGLPVLETDRLHLRPLHMEDAADIFAYASDPEVARHTSWGAHRTIEDSQRFIRSALERYAAGKPGPWGIIERANGRVIGTCGFLWLNPDHRRAELGYVLARPAWNRGYMTEAARAVIAFGFERLGLERIEARCMVENAASARVLEKVGMTFEDTRPSPFIVKGRRPDLKHYAILRQHWDGSS